MWQCRLTPVVWSPALLPCCLDGAWPVLTIPCRPFPLSPSHPCFPSMHVRYLANDRSVEPVSETTVLEAEAYMLYFLRGDLPDTDLGFSFLGPSDSRSQYWYPLS